jgi:hypothetical protein
MISATSLGIIMARAVGRFPSAVIVTHRCTCGRCYEIGERWELVDLPAAVDLAVACSGSMSAVVDDHSGDHAPLKL